MGPLFSSGFVCTVAQLLVECAWACPNVHLFDFSNITLMFIDGVLHSSPCAFAGRQVVQYPISSEHGMVLSSLLCIPFSSLFAVHETLFSRNCAGEKWTLSHVFLSTTKLFLGSQESPLSEVQRASSARCALLLKILSWTASVRLPLD